MSKNTLILHVIGTPAAEPRPRCACIGGRGKAYVKRSDEQKEWRKAIGIQVDNHFDGERFQGPVAIEITLRFPRPQRLKRKKDSPWMIRKDTKPDIDNLAKAILDVLTEKQVWKDDSQVYRLVINKYYVEKDQGRCGARIWIDEMPEETRNG